MNSLLKMSVVAVILAGGMILSASLVSKFFVKIRHEQSIRVKGYAETDLVSDVGRFFCTFSVRGASLAESYAKLQDNRTAVTAYLKKMGFQDDEIVFQTIQTSKVAKRDSQGRETNETEFYDVYQRVMVSSGRVSLIQDCSIGITELIKDGIDISATSPEFTISDLKDTKVALLAKATEDGYRRAISLAENSKGRVGALISAQQGVFQITERNSTDTSDYGEYDTSAIEKTAKAIVTLEYAIEAGK
jgi:hypothetical protein